VTLTLDIDMLYKDRDSCLRAGSILPHYIGGNENLEANVLKTVNADSHSRFEIPPEKPGDSCPHNCLKGLAFKIVTLNCLSRVNRP
jgi:hypothetical protein